MHIKWMKYIIFFVTFALVGAALEYAYGKLWSLFGAAPWIYPNSPLQYTSLEGMPMWGFGGLASIGIYKCITEKSARHIPKIIIPLGLSALWVLLYTHC